MKKNNRRGNKAYQYPNKGWRKTGGQHGVLRRRAKGIEES